MKKICFYLAACLMGCFYACDSNAPDKEVIPEVIEPSEPLEPQEVVPGEPIELTPMQSEKVNADNCFAFKMFKQVSAFDTNPNTFFSPLSLNLALGMLYNGASGDTRTEMAEVLGLADLTETEINAFYRKMSHALLGIDPQTEIGIANSIWYRLGFSVKQPFININQTYFDAMVRELDFNRFDAADIINGWCAEKTNNRIDKIIESPINVDVVMYLINALYFKSLWQNPFDKTITREEDFNLSGSQKKKVNMMNKTADMPYYADQNLQCVELPYGNGAFSMVVVLPADHLDIEHTIAYLDNDTWQSIMSQLDVQKVALKLPRFKVECDLPLNDPVMNVGMTKIFGGGLLNISDNHLCVSEIKQKTFVEVNEEGTEAAAVTVIEMDVTVNLPSVYEQFHANRPFLYLIKEQSTGTILFIGRMDAP